VEIGALVVPTAGMPGDTGTTNPIRVVTVD
jgi:hypothetical protein